MVSAEGTERLREYFDERPIRGVVLFGGLSLIYGAVAVYGLVTGGPLFLWGGLLLFAIHLGEFLRRMVRLRH